MLYVIIGFLVIVVLGLIAFNSKIIPVNPITNWQQLHKMLSVQMAALTGLLAGAIPAAVKLQTMLPDMQAIQALHNLTSSPAYQTFVSALGFFIIIARAWQQGSLSGDAVVSAANQLSSQNVPQTAPKQTGHVAIGFLALLVALASLTALLLPGCATTPTPLDIAYDAQTTADFAYKSIPPLLKSKTITVATAKKIVDAADAVNAAASVVEAAGTGATAAQTAALTAALSDLTTILPAQPAPTK